MNQYGLVDVENLLTILEFIRQGFNYNYYYASFRFIALDTSTFQLNFIWKSFSRFRVILNFSNRTCRRLKLNCEQTDFGGDNVNLRVKLSEDIFRQSSCCAMCFRWFCFDVVFGFLLSLCCSLSRRLLFHNSLLRYFSIVLFLVLLICFVYWRTFHC